MGHIAIFIFSVVTMFLFRFDGLWNVDDTGYLTDVVNGTRSILGLGRPGYVYLYHGLWLIFKKAVSRDFYEYIQFIRFTNVVISGVFLVAVYELLLRLTNRRFLSAVTVVLFFTTAAFLDFVSWTGSDQLMYCFTALSYWAFIAAGERKSKRLLFLSAALFGYAFEVREPAVLLAAFFPLYLCTRKDRSFSTGTFIFAAGVFILVAFLGPVLLLWVYQSEYVSAFLRNIHVVKADRDSGFFDRLTLMVQHQALTPSYLIIPIAFGSMVLSVKPALFGLNHRRLLFFWTVLAIPTFAVVIMHSQWALLESRFALPLILASSFSVTVCLEALRLLLKKYLRWSGAIPIAILAALVAAQFCLRWGNMTQLKQVTAATNGYFERIRPYMNRNTVLLVGMEFYPANFRARIEDIPLDYIDPGWNWPKDLLASDIRAHLESGQQVIYDPLSSWYEYNLKDINALRGKFEFERLAQGFIRIKNRSD